MEAGVEVDESTEQHTSEDGAEQPPKSPVRDTSKIYQLLSEIQVKRSLILNTELIYLKKLYFYFWISGCIKITIDFITAEVDFTILFELFLNYQRIMLVI